MVDLTETVKETMSMMTMIMMEFPLMEERCFSDPLDANSVPTDTDGDGDCDPIDYDDDGDGFTDINEDGVVRSTG